MRLALAQINTVVGDLDRNRDRIVTRIREAKEEGADVVLFPELVVTGYPPEDLLLRPSFVRAAARTLEEIARESRGIVALVGVPLLERDLYNACAVCAGGEVKARYRKRFLPNYGVFDEDRYFAPGDDLLLLEHGSTLVGPTPSRSAGRSRRGTGAAWGRWSPSRSTTSSRCGSRSSSASPTTWRRTASARSSWASRAGSTRRSSRRSRPRRSAPSESTASRCRRSSPPKPRAPTRAGSPKGSAAPSSSCRSSRSWRSSGPRWHRSSASASPISPRRTCRRGRAACS